MRNGYVSTLHFLFRAVRRPALALVAPRQKQPCLPSPATNWSGFTAGPSRRTRRVRFLRADFRDGLKTYPVHPRCILVCGPITKARSSNTGGDTRMHLVQTARCKGAVCGWAMSSVSSSARSLNWSHGNLLLHERHKTRATNSHGHAAWDGNDAPLYRPR